MTPTSRIPWWMAFAMAGAGVLMLAVFLAPRNDLPVLARPASDARVLRIVYPQVITPDPHRWNFFLPSQSQLILSLWEPLVECDPESGQPQPAAAESWRWSDDRLTLTVKLRPDGRWCNGDPVTAHDYVRSWRRLIGQELDWCAALFPVKNAEAIHRGELADSAALGVEAVDDLTLRISLNAVRSTFVAELADPLLVPLHTSSPEVFKQRAFFQSPELLVTNGAFRLVKAGPEGFRLAVSPHYRDRADLRLSGLEFIRADNASMARLLVAVGRADIANPPATGAPSGMPTTRCVTEQTEMVLRINSLDLNVARAHLRDVRVRRALALAINRAGSIAASDADVNVPAYSWVPDMPGRPSLSVMREDADEARRLLADAGYPGGRGFPVLVLPVNPYRENFANLQAWTDQWHRELGVRTYLAMGTTEERKRRMETGDFDIALNGLIATVPDAGDLLSVFAYPERFNIPSWRNPEFTRMMTEANQKAGIERMALLEQFERRALEDALTIPMLFERRRTLLAIEVAGWYPDPLGRQALKRLAIEPLVHEDETGRSSL